MVLEWKKRKRVHVNSYRKDITHTTNTLVKDLKAMSKQEATDKTKAIYHSLLLIAEINNLISESLTNINSPTYLTSTLFLKDCFNLLNQREVESLHFVTGPEIGDVRVLDQIIDFKLKHQSIVYAKADSSEVRKVLIKLNQYKFKLWGYFHIHPGSGSRSTFPSGTDINLKKLFDKGGYEAVGAIFSRDGWIRFFSPEKLKIHIYGEGVKKVNEKLYHLAKVS